MWLRRLGAEWYSLCPWHWKAGHTAPLRWKPSAHIRWIAPLALTTSKILGYSDHVPWIPQACSPRVTEVNGWPPPQRTPCCPAFEICLLNSLLRYSRATTINFSSSSIYFWIDSLHLLNPPGEYCSGLCHGKRVAALHHWLILDERSFTKSYQALWQSPGLVPCMS